MAPDDEYGNLMSDTFSAILQNSDEKIAKQGFYPPTLNGNSLAPYAKDFLKGWDSWS